MKKLNKIREDEDYQKLQERYEKLLIAFGELRGKLEEKENTLKIKNELIEEFRNRIRELQEQRKNKKWWEFWK